MVHDGLLVVHETCTGTREVGQFVQTGGTSGTRQIFISGTRQIIIVVHDRLYVVHDGLSVVHDRLLVVHETCTGTREVGQFIQMNNKQHCL